METGIEQKNDKKKSVFEHIFWGVQKYDYIHYGMEPKKIKWVHCGLTTLVLIFIFVE